VFDGKPENFVRWEIQWNAFVKVEGISGAQEDTLSGYMPEDANTAIPTMALLTDRGKARLRPRLSKTTGSALNTMQLHWRR
jgi:hypothetical protein